MPAPGGARGRRLRLGLGGACSARASPARARAEGKLDALCEESGYPRSDVLMGMIDGETDEVARLQWRKENPRPPKRASPKLRTAE